MSHNQTENQSAVGNAKHATKKASTGQVPVYKKYTGNAEQNWLDPSAKLKPSDLEKPSLNVSADDYPLIIEFCNLQDNSAQVHTTVEIEKPLFQPAPKIVIFEDYAPFATHEKKLFFRNNDSVARRIKLVQPGSAFFEMSAPRLASGEPLRSSSIAAGMEIYFMVIFKPQEVRDYSWDLVCCTEREKFIVPIRAIGMRPRVTFPDTVDFGLCPVKSAMRKVLLVQNVGAAPANFTMKSLTKEFSCPGEEMLIEPGASQMIELFLTPPTADPVQGEYEIEFFKGPKCYIAASGAGKNVNVSLSTPSVALEPSYISLTSQSVVKVRNQSEIPIHFKWKSFAKEADEENERARLLAEVERMEDIERATLMQRIQEGFYNTVSLDEYGNEMSSNVMEDDVDDAGIPFNARAEEAQLVRKYRNLKRALEVDSMLFVDDIFDINPVEGTVWANSELEVTVSFRPDTAAQYACYAHLDVSGRAARLPLNMAGQGIGPHAMLSFDVLDVGDVFINDEQHYKVSIINKGDIHARWHFESSLTKFGNKFSFSPTEGHLAPGDSQVLDITFESDILGEFSENFRFALQGNEDMLVCQIKGHVVGPTFHFDCSNIDFGIVSYDYLHESKMRLVNSSKIAMVFNLHVPQDGTYLKKEFNVEPCEGTLQPGQHMDILLEFIPASVKVYDYSLVVDVLGVGDVLLSIPISAECVVAPVVLEEREVDFGQCFIRYPYEKEITLRNSSSIVHTKFEVLPQQNYTKSTATFEAEPAIAVIEPNDSMKVTIRLVCEKLGSYKIPILLQTAGSQEPPQQAVLIFDVVGPKVIVDQPEVRWGNVECLKDSVRSLRITNDSLITANMKLFLKNARSKFELGTRELSLEPYEYYDLQITANLDDSVICKEEVHLIVEESDNVMVPLSAKGVGTTMHCGTDLKRLDMGVQLTNTHFEKRIVLENKGRRPQYLKWTNQTNVEINAERAEKVKNLGKEAGSSLPKHLLPREPYFTVALEEITLRPRTATTFVFKGKCNTAGHIEETLVLESRVGKERVMKPIIECTVCCDVVNPLLDFNFNELNYVYKWERNVEPSVQSRELVLKNASAVPLSFVMKTEVPFNLGSFECSLKPGESTDVTVDFDPMYKDNRQSHVVESQLSINYRGHPQKDCIKLSGDIIFPNLEFETKTINFGCILNDSRKTIRVKVTNTSKAVATYDWCFLEEQQKKAPIGSRKGPAKSDEKHSAASLVDILPINSVLQPGDSEYVEFSFFGLANAKISGQVLCNVEGGPEYKLSIQGEASQMAYALDRSFVDFGKVTFTESAEQQFNIKNTGKVPFVFKVEPGSASAGELIEILPKTGKVPAGESISVQLKIYPGIPANIVESLLVSIAHFDAIPLPCFCQGIFPTAVVSLPRYRRIGPFNETEGPINQMWADFVSGAISNLSSPDESLLPPSESLCLAPASANSSLLPEFVMPRPPPPAAVEADESSVLSLTSAKSPPQQALEVEMTRITFERLLIEKVKEVDVMLAERLKNPPVEVVEEVTKKTTKKVSAPQEPVVVFPGLQSKIAEHVKLTEIVAATHLCDFGNVIIGQSRKKVFKITNAALVGQLNWTFDSSRLSANGFTIEPFKASKLIEGDSVDFVVKFTARSSSKLGKKHSVLPLENKGSPTINIVMQANVCLPEVVLSTETVDMESILIGQTKKMYIRLHNPTPVTATWALKKNPSKDERAVNVFPSEGTLRAGRKSIVCVEFMPSAASKIVQEFTLKVDNNNLKPKVLKVVGEGLGVVLKWDTPMMELGPIIPFTEGDEKVVTLTNHSQFGVEIFSLDFDSRFKEEEAMLSQLELYDREGLYRCEIREPGAALCNDILEAFNALKAKAAAESAQIESKSEDIPAATTEPEGDVFTTAPLRTSKAPRDDNQHQDIIVVGPPISGVTTMSNHLGKKLSLTVSKFDAMLREVAQTDGEVGSIARRCSNSMSDAEKATVQEKEKQLLAAAAAAKEAAEAAFRGNKANKGKEPTAADLRTPEAQAVEDFQASGKLSADIIAKIVVYRLSWVDAGWGFIIDSLVSDFTNEATLLQGLEKALPAAIVANIVLQGGSEQYEARIREMHAVKTAEIKRLGKSIQSNLRERAKLVKKPQTKKGAKSSGTATLASELAHTSTASEEIPVALPLGDEPWVNQEPGPEHGQITELDSQGVKALDDHVKPVYYKQLLYAQDCALKSAHEVVAKINRIWRAEKGLMTAQTAAESLDAAGFSEEKEEPADSEGAAAEADANKGAEEEKAESRPATSNAKLLPPLKLDRVVYYNDYAESTLQAVASAFVKTAATEVAATPADGANLAEPVQPGPVEFGVFDIQVEADEAEDIVLNNLMALLPQPKVAPEDKDKTPITSVQQLIHKPYPRSDRRAVRCFEILRMDPVDPAAEAAKAEAAKAAAEAAAAAAAASKGKKGAVVEAAPVVVEPEAKPVSYRWVVAAGESIQMKIRFRSKVEGKYDVNLGFEVLGTGQTINLHCGGYCEVPAINTDSRNVFMRRVKSIAPGAPPAPRKFVINDNAYSFGPLLLYKKASWMALAEKPAEALSTDEANKLNAIKSTNTDTVRITNSGRFACKVELGLENLPAEGQDSLFVIEPKILDLEEGETKDVKIWAFPTAVGEFKNTLCACVQNNATPMKFPISCWGVEPTVEITGPWAEKLAAAEAALAANTDKKAEKDLQDKLAALKAAFTFDFDRLLVNKTESKSFTLKNTSFLPVAWEIDLGDFKGSANVSITPDSGVIPVNGAVEISVNFTSPTPLLLTGGFKLRFSDNENGLTTTDRVGVRNFKVITEAYNIQSVALNADGQEQDGGSIDYGIVRVGDFATQKVKIANKGKYRIGYKFIIPKASTAALISIDKMEGVIEPGNTPAEVALTFCSREAALVLKGNKDVKVQISEPLSGEIVETFPLYISADARFNRFRLQPSKGVTFGAVRFDAAAKTKRVELRNESKFDFTYVICPKSAEVDELDVLDKAALACYAHATPAARRKLELGENYKERLSGPAETKAPAKGGKGAAAAPAAAANAGNPLVADPDALPMGELPTDPLVVGAFKVTPRVGRVAPGETVGIDMTFDPNGSDIAREHLRVCISGIDPSEPLSQVLRSFEVTGESCFPAILNKDLDSIFEEQEVVENLAESIPGGGGKIEKLPVGKVVYSEKERVLAFGPLSCGGPGAKGAVERIRITNPTKIDVKVNFAIKSPDAASAPAAAPPAKGKAAAAAPPPDAGAASSAFVVQPQTWDIPPHEHRFVSVYFNPTEIKSYRSIFHAEVDYGGSTSTAVSKSAGSGKTLTFDLAGSGTLPCIVIDQPTERSPDGSLVLAFGKVHINRTCKRRLVIRNDGVMPSTCLFEMDGSPDFKFGYAASSLTIEPGAKKDMFVTFSPTKVGDDANRIAKIKVTVLNNQFDHYVLNLTATTYACDATLDLGEAEKKANELDADGNVVEAEEKDESGNADSDAITMTELNLAEGAASCTKTITVSSRSQYPIKFAVKAADGVQGLSFSPSTGHLGPLGKRQVTVTFSAAAPIKLDKAAVTCTLTRIEYKPDPAIPEGQVDQAKQDAEVELWGVWDDSMKSSRKATSEDLAAIKAAADEMKAYLDNKAAQEALGKKGKPVGPPPAACPLKLGEPDEEGNQMIDIVFKEPYHEIVAGAEVQKLNIAVNAVADVAKFSCQYEGENIPFVPTFLFQSTTHSFTFTNECNITLPVSWSFDDIKRRTNTAARTAQTARTTANRGTANNAMANIPCPFFIDPEDCAVGPKQTKVFKLKFQPLDADDFVYALKGVTIPSLPLPPKAGEEAAEPGALRGPVRMVLRGSANRPICHFDMKESTEYLARRLPNMKNELGLFAPIESADLRVVELESTGLRTRNTYRFHIINTTGENYEFKWETCGDPSGSWRCVQSAGMLFAGKRIEIVFEYLPEETTVAESFFKFRLPNASVEQLFLFSGRVVEPKVFFSSSRLDFHSVMLGGQGSLEQIYLENSEHLPFNFQFDKLSLLQLDGTNGPVLDINPKQGTVAPHGRVPITFLFKPQDEVVYNFNIVCDVKRKPNKLSINVKGEGYAVHPVVMLELNEQQIAVNASDNRFQALKPRPAVNYADFGSVKVLDTTSKTLTVTNNGKYNFDYLWDIDNIGNMLTLTGGKTGGTLHKGEEMSYTLTFAPQREASLDGSMLSFTVAGKYTYDIYARGIAQSPALRFSFMQYDFGPCFVTSPGGQTVVVETSLRLVNHDPTSNIAVECNFQKTRALWVECPPTVLEPGAVLDVPIRFAPRDVKDYTFVLPFVINATSKANITVVGKGINALLELVNASQRRTPFGIVNVGSEVRKVIPIINRSKKALPVQIIEETEFGSSSLDAKCVTVSPRSEFVIAPRETVNLQVSFAPNTRIASFSEDVMVRYAGVTRKLVTLSGKGQGAEVALDTDSLPFGNVVINSSQVKTLSLENSGDVAITFQWVSSTFGRHFSISPLQGKLQPNSEMTFDVTFCPVNIDDDIRQDNIILQIPGMSPLQLTCTGACIDQPASATNTLEFNSIARKAETKNVKFTNPTDKDWFLSPTLSGINWKIPNEIKVPAKGSADFAVTYFPLTMCKKPDAGQEDTAHKGKLFAALPDGTAQLYNLRGYAGPPECSGKLLLETSAKKPCTSTIKITNWLKEAQKLKVTIDLSEKPSPATFIIAANAVELNPSGSKEFPIRFVSYTEGTAKGTVTFTNPLTGEYAFYEITAKTTMPEVLEEIKMESCVRQSAKYVISLENPLPADSVVEMSKNNDWWSCDSDCVRVKELTPLSGNPEGSFEIEYRPLASTLQPGEHLLTISCKALGTYKYKLKVTATPPPLPQSLKFEVPLGTLQTESFVFKSFNKAKIDYTCNIGKADLFTVPKTVTVEPCTQWDGTEVRVSVSFEPTKIGDIRDTLKITAPGGIEYLCDVLATCIPAMPQGPYNVTMGGGNVDIPFRNYFAEAQGWSFSVDSPHFKLATQSAQVPAKSGGNCQVSFAPAEGSVAPGGTLTGKLFIKCTNKPELAPFVCYLKGIAAAAGAAVEAPAAGKKK